MLDYIHVQKRSWCHICLTYHPLVCLQLRLQAAKVSGFESRELLRAGWDDAIKTHLKDSAPLPLSLTEQHRQVGWSIKPDGGHTRGSGWRLDRSPTHVLP